MTALACRCESKEYAEKWGTFTHYFGDGCICDSHGDGAESVLEPVYWQGSKRPPTRPLCKPKSDDAKAFSRFNEWRDDGVKS